MVTLLNLSGFFKMTSMQQRNDDDCVRIHLELVGAADSVPWRRIQLSAIFLGAFTLETASKYSNMVAKDYL